MAGPWEKYGQQPVGDPIIAPADPYKQAAEQRANQLQQIQAERLDLARTANERADRAEARATAVEERQAAQAERGSVEQGKAAAFLRRAINAEDNFRSLGEVQPRSLPGQMFKDQFPNAANYISDSERQRADQAEREFIAAVLRYDSGAAIPDSEFVTNGQIYFPRPGDTPETLAQKAQARRTAIEGLFAASGPAASDIQLPDFGAARPSDGTRSPEMVGDVPKGTRVELGMDRWGEDDPWNRADYLQETYGISPNQEAAITAFWNANRGNQGLTLQGAKAWYTENGIPAPSDADLAAGVERARAGEAGFGQFDTSQAEADYLAALDRIIAERGIDPEAMSETAGQSAASGVTLGLIDELGGAGGAVRGLVQGNSPIGGYQVERDVMRRIRERGAAANPGTALAGELVGGLATGALGVGGRGRTAMQVARDLRGTGQAVSRGAIQSGMVRDATVQGAKIGGVAGFGYGEGAEGSAANALLGAAGGAAVGNLLQRGGNVLANRGPSGAPPSSGGRVMQAADDLGIEPTPAVVGGRTTQILTGGARQGFISDRPISRAVERMEGQGQAARDRIASNAGQVLDAEDAGDVVRQAANVYSQRTSQIGGNLYTRADRRAGGIKLPLPKAVQAADEEMAQLAKGPGGTDSAIYKDLAKLKSQMERGSFEVDGIRAFRSRIRTEMTERGLRGTPQDVAFGRILQAAEEDMITGLQAAGKTDAAAALKTAASFWRKRVETIDQVLEPVIGKNAPKSGEQIVTALENMANPKSGNASRLRGLFKAMPDDEARAVSATIINRMGQPTKGSANMAEEGGFSFNTFLTNYNNMSPRAKAAIFDGETRDALAKLATVSRGVKEAGGAANTSNTAGAAVVQTFVSGGLWYLEPMTAVAGAAGQFAIGKLLASPRFARIIAGAPKANTPQARKALSVRLADLARAQPALANEIGLYRTALERAANDNAVVVRSVAQDQNAEERR